MAEEVLAEVIKEEETVATVITVVDLGATEEVAVPVIILLEDQTQIENLLTETPIQEVLEDEDADKIKLVTK